MREAADDQQHSTRHCPACGAIDLRISLEDDGYINTACAGCGRVFRSEAPGGVPHYVDPEWVAAAEQ